MFEKLDKLNTFLTWKNIFLIYTAGFMVVVLFLTIGASKQETKIRSKASEVVQDVKKPVQPIPDYPKSEPLILRVRPFYGKRGDAVVVSGSNFGNYQWASKVFIGTHEIEQKYIKKWTDRRIDLFIPDSVETGEISIIVNGARHVWEGIFYVEVSGQPYMTLGISQIDDTASSVWLSGPAAVDSIVLEIGHKDSVEVVTNHGEVRQGVSIHDEYGQKTLVEISGISELKMNKTNLFTIRKSKTDKIELLQAFLFDEDGDLIPVLGTPGSFK
jgi:hypothetical protein